MGCTLHQHGHSHGGMSHGHSHGGGGGHGHGHSNPKPHQNGGFVEDPESNHNHGSESKETSGESNGSSTQVAINKPNINVRAAYIHVIGDFLQSVGVFAAALVIYFEVRFFFAWIKVAFRLSVKSK